MLMFELGNGQIATDTTTVQSGGVPRRRVVPPRRRIYYTRRRTHYYETTHRPWTPAPIRVVTKSTPRFHATTRWAKR